MTARNLYPVWTWVLWALMIPMGLLAIGGGIVATTDVRDLPFDNAHLWWLIASAPLAGLLFVYAALRKRRGLRRFASAQLGPLLGPEVSPTRPAVRGGLFVVALIAVSAAIVGPRWGIYMVEQKVRGVDVVVALDVSRSMLVRDVPPYRHRLAQAKQEIRQQLTERDVFQGAHRLALMAFSGTTSLRLPLTTDHLAFRSKLEELHVGVVPRGGTDIGHALREAVDLFARSPEQATKILLLFTDGEDHEGGAVEAAREAFDEHGIRVYTIGVGDSTLTAGGQVPSDDGGGAQPMLYDGQIVFSKLDVDGLREIADAGGGRYALLEDLHRLVSAIARMRQAELSTEERMRHMPRYQWFVVLALLLLAWETIIGERRTTPHRLSQRVWQQENGA